MKDQRKPHERILARTAKQPGISGCWEWQGYATQDGYGQIRVGGRVEYVHRAMAQYYGLSIDGLTVDHLCRNTRCVRESHLEVVSREENTRRGNSKAWNQYITEKVKERHLTMEFAPDLRDPARAGYRRALAAEANLKHLSGQPFTVEDMEQQYRWLVSLTVCDCGTYHYAPLDVTPNGRNDNRCGDCQAD